MDGNHVAFGTNSLGNYYLKLKFEITWKDSIEVLYSVYTKQDKNKRKIRIERQEYPMKSIADALDEKLHTRSIDI